MSVQQIIDDTLREYKRNQKGTALGYIRLARKIASSGLPKTRALEITNRCFPQEHRAFLAAQSRGETLPVLFPRSGESYESRRKAAVSSGGIIR